ncbi:hypothetical protein ACTXT7_012821 [Hymenolepis weldensis]
MQKTNAPPLAALFLIFNISNIETDILFAFRFILLPVTKTGGSSSSRICRQAKKAANPTNPHIQRPVS